MDLDNPPDPPGSPPYPLPGTSVMLLPLKLASENAIQAQFPLMLMDTVLSSKLTFFRLCADLKYYLLKSFVDVIIGYIKTTDKSEYSLVYIVTYEQKYIFLRSWERNTISLLLCNHW